MRIGRRSGKIVLTSARARKAIATAMKFCSMWLTMTSLLDSARRMPRDTTASSGSREVAVLTDSGSGSLRSLSYVRQLVAACARRERQSRHEVRSDRAFSGRSSFFGQLGFRRILAVFLGRLHQTSRSSTATCSKVCA